MTPAKNHATAFATAYTDDLHIDTRHSLIIAAAVKDPVNVTDEHEHDGPTASR